jgi:hypothetical protein
MMRQISEFPTDIAPPPGTLKLSTVWRLHLRNLKVRR